MFMPAGACKYLASLWLAIQTIWPTMYDPAILAGQVEAESCYTIKHSKCWNPHSELKTSREYGFGFGQTTIAYRTDGSVRFNKWAELRRQYKTELSAWTWENRYDPVEQLKAMVLMMEYGWNKFKEAEDNEQRIKFTLAGYNGGDGSVIKDIGLCRKTKNCNPNRWDGNVAVHSYKSKKKWKNYGNRSPFEINRQYPVKVFKAAKRYEPYQPIDHILPFMEENNINNVCVPEVKKYLEEPKG